MKSNDNKTKVPRIGEGIRGVDGYSVYLLRQAAGALRSAMDRALEPVELTHPQFAVLALLNFYPGASGADLARLSQLTPQTLTVITRNLAAAKLIRRGKAADGQRQIPYELTPHGQTIMVRGKRLMTDIEADIADGFSAAEVAIVKRWMVEVAKRLYAPKKPGERPRNPSRED